MKKPETDLEILEFAIWKERQAIRLFQTLAGRISQPDIVSLLEELAAEERSHVERLELEILKTGRTITPAPEQNDPADILFTGKLELDMTAADILTLAVEKEDSSFRLYVSLIPQIQDPAAREVLIALAEQEVRHKLLFESQRQKLMTGTD